MKKAILILMVSFLAFELTSCDLMRMREDLYILDPNSSNYAIDSKDLAPIHKQGKQPRILFMGDSRAFNGGSFEGIENEVYNLGVSSSTTRSIRNKLYRIKDINPDIVFIFTGINDGNYVPMDEFKDNLTHIASYLASCNIECIILDQTIKASIPSPYKEIYAPCKPIMEHVPFTEYLSIQYTDDCFSDYFHLTPKGYSTVISSIRIWMIEHRYL